MANLRAAKMRLKESSHTFVCLIATPSGEDKVYESDGKGLAPILEKMDLRKKYFKDAYVADRVVGKAAAMLLVASGARGIYGEVMSESAKKFMETVMYDRTMGRNNAKLVEFEAKTVVPYIKNAKNSGLCPMENAVLELERFDEAYDILKAQHEQLQQDTPSSELQ